MVVHGDNKPQALRVSQPNAAGQITVRAAENAREDAQSEHGGWVWDEYRLTLPDRPGLAEDIAANPAPYREQARREDAELTTALQSYIANGWLTEQDAEEVYRAPAPLEIEKKLRIAQSKAALEEYLKTHPLQWTDGQQYAITADKQQQLTGKLMAASMAQTMSADYKLTWNSTGEVCREWAFAELAKLAFGIDKRVTSLVTYQQQREVAMRAAKDADALRAVTVDYDSVPIAEEGVHEGG